MADTLSRTPTLNQEREQPVKNNKSTIKHLETQVQLAECLLVHPEFDKQGRYPCEFSTIHHYQQRSQKL